MYEKPPSNQPWRLLFYNPETGQILGRTPSSWGKHFLKTRAGALARNSNSVSNKFHSLIIIASTFRFIQFSLIFCSRLFAFL